MIETITFDCYGTLMDWDKVVEDFFQEILPQYDSRKRLEIKKKWEEIQLQLIVEKYRPYEELQNESFLNVFKFFRISNTPSSSFGRRFMNRLSSCKPVHDVIPFLHELKKTFRLVLISNGPLDLLRQHSKNMQVQFDHIISAEFSRAYKPSQAVFRYALEQIREPKERVLHVAAGYKYDVIPAKNLGWNVVWLNRRGEALPGNIYPDFEIYRFEQFFDQVKLPFGVPHKTTTM